MVEPGKIADGIYREVIEEVALDIDRQVFSDLNQFRLARIRDQAVEINQRPAEALAVTNDDAEISSEEIQILSSSEWDGEVLRSIRDRLGLTQEELGEMVGVSLRTIS